MRVKKVYEVYCDPGHGWIKVPIKELVRLGIEKLISHFSYVKGDYAYLEEDCDAGYFFDAKKKKGEEIVQKAYHSNNMSRIRNYNSYCFISSAKEV